MKVEGEYAAFMPKVNYVGAISDAVKWKNTINMLD